MNGHDYSWLDEAQDVPPVVVNQWDGLVTVGLTKISTGARLMWVLAEDFPRQYGLFAHLTYDEAQTVFDTPVDVGLLERIRVSMNDRQAMVWSYDGERFGSDNFTIPAGGSEPEFSETIMAAAAAVKLRVDVDEFEQHERERVGSPSSSLAASPWNAADQQLLRTYLTSMAAVAG